MKQISAVSQTPTVRNTWQCQDLARLLSADTKNMRSFAGETF